MKKNRWMTRLGNLLMLCLAGVAVYVLSFGATLLQEKDTFSILVTAARMKISGAELGNVGSSRQRWLMRAGCDYAPLDNALLARGWVRAKRQGPVGVYKRNGHPIYIRFKKYSPAYVICQADRQP